MGKIYTVMGKSATGKDTIYKRVLDSFEGRFKNVVMYTTRPIRYGEVDGVEYFFTTREDMMKLENDKKIIEWRRYDTVYGPWWYFTADDGQIDLEHNDYLMITTLVGFEQMSDYFGKERVVPIYVEIDNGTRLTRAVEREKKQERPNFSEVCRRYLADEKDFAEVELMRLDISTRFINDDLDRCVDEIVQWISK